MDLQYGITSFYDLDRGKPPAVDFKKFKGLCYSVSREIGMKISKIDKDGLAHNYYYAIFGHNKNIGLVCNSKYPLVSFVHNFTGPRFGGVLESAEHESIPSLVDSTGYFQYLGASQLKESLSTENCKLLGNSEIKQIQYWSSTSVGEVVFNYYD